MPKKLPTSSKYFGFSCHISNNTLTDMDLYIWASCFTLTLTGVYCALVRLFHMCRPYDKYRHYFYPSRKTVTILFLLPLLQIPYLMHPESVDAWLLERCLIVMCAPAFGAIALRSFLHSDLQKWLRKTSWFILLPALLIIFLIIHGSNGGNKLEPNENLIIAVSLILSSIIAGNLIAVFVKMMKIIKRMSREEYSNEEDFPARFGVITANISVSLWVLAIIVILIDNQIFAAACNNIVTVILFVLLIAILHPQRAKCALIEDRMVRIIEEKRKESLTTLEEEHEKHVSDIPSQVKKDIEGKIRKLVIDGKLYLNPNFNKTELVTLVGTNRTYLSEVLRDSFGSFYSFINKLRIEYAAEYSREHPTATNSEIAAQSGFGSVRTYTRIRSLYNNGEL